jgi:hypothetical protein
MSCVFENFTSRDFAFFVVACVIAGCLMIWTINLSIDRLLYADWEQTTSLPQQQIRSAQADRPDM